MDSIRDLLELSRHGIVFSDLMCKKIAHSVESLSKFEGYQSFLKFIEILGELSSPLNQNHQYAQLDKSNGTAESHKLKVMYQYVNHHFNEKVKLIDIAGALSLSLIHISEPTRPY